MPNSPHDPDLNAAMRAAGVEYRPGLAQEVMGELGPFLADEGLDLNDLRDTDLDTLNAGLARATARYNQSLAGAGPVVSPVGGSPFIRTPSAHRARATATRDDSPPQHRRQSTVRRDTGRAKKDRSDRTLVREFDGWLGEQPVIAAPSPGEEAGMFAELLKVAKSRGWNLNTPDDVLALLELLDAIDDDEPDGTIEAAIATLHDYVHFRMESAADPEQWHEVDDVANDLMADPFPGADILDAAIAEAEQIDPDERRSALGTTRIISAVPELLAWIGSGRKVAPSGGLRRVDIAQAAGLLGVAAVGVDKLPPDAPDAPYLFPVHDPETPLDAIRARSMQNVPLLPAWWVALASAEIIHVGTYRVTHGPAAAQWKAELLPPLEQAEVVVALTVAQYVCQDMNNRSAFFADRAAAIMITRVLQALAPDQAAFSADGDEWVELLDGRVTHDLRRLETVGVLTSTAQGDFVVPAALRGAVARGVVTAVAILSGELEAD